MSYAIGIDIGATLVKSVVVTPAGELLNVLQFETRAEDNDWCDRIKQHVLDIQTARGDANQIGLAAPGLAAADHRTIAWMRGRLSGIEGLDWTAYLNGPRIVPVLNDAHAALLGEAWLGAAAGCDNAVLLTLGTGVGGAIFCDGRLLQGAIGRAGHLGHLSLNFDGSPDLVRTPGSLEDAIGDHTVAARTAGRFTSTAALVAAARSGDDHARVAWLRSVKALAAAVASIVNAVDPQRVIIGGGIAAAGPALFEPLAEFLDAMEWRPLDHRVRIAPAALGERAGAIGAARYAMTFEQEKAE